jgi:calcineurin-like phosphoesterase family protein
LTNIWLISDTHFNHSNIIKYCDRPYKNTSEMDWDMVEKWNSVVKPNDHVYHLGDVYMKASKGYIENLLSNLNGKKRLILGNHDNGKDQILLKHFEKIVLWRNFDKVVLSHIPLRQESIPGDRLNVHGHIHRNKSPDGPYKCVCVEQTNYTPINLEEIKV